jgi:subtilisin family serine protease
MQPKSALRTARRAARLCFLCLMLGQVVAAESGTVAGRSLPERLPAPLEASPMVSLVLRLENPDLHARFLAAGGPAADARVSRLRADLLRDQLAGAEAEILAEQDRVAAAATRLGASVVGRYSVVGNGLLLHADPALLPRLRALPGVQAVEPAPRLRLDLDRSVPEIGADRVARELGYDGSGTVIAIIDAGIDYTHADFGGPGLAAAYSRAAIAAETIDDLWDGQPFFPTDKVIGGYDLVGPLYTNPAYCSLDQERAGRCRRSPEPDPDPLDQHGHGSHVAGIAAGQGSAELAAGVAPGASLVALKIYGPPSSGISVDEEVDVVIGALDWVARVNLGMAVPGSPPPRVDVVNMSLGEPWGQASPLFDEALTALVDLGVVVVASAGNEGNNPYIHGAPGANPRVISVANYSFGALDQVVGSSSRGPSRHGGIKPNLSAPGSNINSASMGSGGQGRRLSGTSMSAPHVAGAAALLIQRSRAEGLGLSAPDIGALLMNQARPDIMAMSNVGELLPAGVSRQGAGRADVWDAARAQLVARAGDIADLDLAAPQLAAAEVEIRRSIRLRNLGAQDRYVLAQAQERQAGKGLTPILPDEPIWVPAGAEVELPISFRLEAASLQPWPRGQRALDAAALDALELDGHILLKAVDASGQPIDEPSPSLPYLALPRRASAISGRIEPDGAQASFHNRGQAGDVELFVLPEPPPGRPLVDPDEAGLDYGLDLAEIGLRFDLAPDGSPRLSLAIASHAPAALPNLTVTEIFLDSDDDGRDDYRLRYGSLPALGGGPPNASLMLTLVRWDPIAQQAVGGESSLPVAPQDLHSSLSLLEIPLSAIGMGAPGPISIGLLRRGATEDWLRGPVVDAAPDGADQPNGARYRLDPGAWSRAPESWSLALPAGETVTIGLASQPGAPPDAGTPRLLGIYPDNPSEPSGSQAAALGESLGPTPRLLLPLLNKHR